MAFYTAQQLSEMTLEEIIKINEDTNRTHKYFLRSVLVSYVLVICKMGK